MKVVKIKTKITLDSGIEIPAGAIVVPVENYVEVKPDANGNLKTQIAVNVFASELAYSSGKKPVLGSDVPPVISSTVTLADYTAKDGDNLAALTVQAALIPIYTALNLNIINV